MCADVPVFLEFAVTDAMGQSRDFESDLEAIRAATDADGGQHFVGHHPDDGSSLVHSRRDWATVEAELAAFQTRVSVQRQAHLAFLDDVVAADRVELWLADGAPR